MAAMKEKCDFLLKKIDATLLKKDLSIEISLWFTRRSAMRYIDLTGTIENGMWEYGDPYPKVEITQICSVEDDCSYAEYRVNAHKITFSSSSGTYVQSSSEMFSDRDTIEKISLDRLIIKSAVMKIPKGAREKVTVEDLEKSGVIPEKGDGLIVATCWDSHWNMPDFVTHSPHFTPESMEWILQKKVSLLAGDMSLYDDYHNPTGLLRELFKQDLLVVAPLIHLDRITHPFITLMALPLKIVGVSGSPCRVIAIEA